MVHLLVSFLELRREWGHSREGAALTGAEGAVQKQLDDNVQSLLGYVVRRDLT